MAEAGTALTKKVASFAMRGRDRGGDAGVFSEVLRVTNAAARDAWVRMQ